MEDECSVTIVHGSQQQHSVTQLWRHTVPDGILHKNLKFRQFTYTAALFTVTASDGTDRTLNKLYSAAAYSGKYSGHCVVLALLIECLLFVIR